TAGMFGSRRLEIHERAFAMLLLDALKHEQHDGWNQLPPFECFKKLVRQFLERDATRAEYVRAQEYCLKKGWINENPRVRNGDGFELDEEGEKAQEKDWPSKPDTYKADWAGRAYWERLDARDSALEAEA